MTTYKRLSSVKELIEASEAHPVFLLKHSKTCPISAQNKKDTDQFFVSHPNEVGYLLIVQEQRELSNKIAEELGVKHETFQLIYLSEGKVKDVLNHYESTKENIEKLIEDSA